MLLPWNQALRGLSLPQLLPTKENMSVRQTDRQTDSFFFSVLYCAGKPIENAAYGLNINQVKILQKK